MSSTCSYGLQNIHILISNHCINVIGQIYTYSTEKRNIRASQINKYQLYAFDKRSWRIEINQRHNNGAKMNCSIIGWTISYLTPWNVYYSYTSKKNIQISHWISFFNEVNIWIIRIKITSFLTMKRLKYFPI